MTIAVDCMGGDHGPQVTVPAASDFVAEQTGRNVVLVGVREAIEAELTRCGVSGHPQIRVQHASEVIGMDEPPAQAMRGKRDSSMRVAINLVKSGEAQACVSAGNTGALMMISKFVLKTLPGVDRPAIARTLPTMRGTTCVLDLGANVDCTAEHLLQFGVMGSGMVSAMEHVDKPTVGLLNIGEERIKGNDVVKQAGVLLRDSGLNFFGNVEGDDIFKGTTDVVVCDGFVGNVALKTSEGLAEMLAAFLREEFERSLWTKLGYVTARPVIDAFKRRVDSRRYNGASLLGLRSIVLKSHGSADRLAFACALQRAHAEAASGMLTRITERMATATH